MGRLLSLRRITIPLHGAAPDRNGDQRPIVHVVGAIATKKITIARPRNRARALRPLGGLPFSRGIAAEVVTLRVVPAVSRRSAATTRADDVRAGLLREAIAASQNARTTAARPAVFREVTRVRVPRVKVPASRPDRSASDVALVVALFAQRSRRIPSQTGPLGAPEGAPESVPSRRRSRCRSWRLKAQGESALQRAELHQLLVEYEFGHADRTLAVLANEDRRNFRILTILVIVALTP